MFTKDFGHVDSIHVGIKKKKRFVYNTLYVYKRQLTYQS
jgi:hypothetical protein